MSTLDGEGIWGKVGVHSGVVCVLLRKRGGRWCASAEQTIDRCERIRRSCLSRLFVRRRLLELRMTATPGLNAGRFAFPACTAGWKMESGPWLRSAGESGSGCGIELWPRDSATRTHRRTFRQKTLCVFKPQNSAAARDTSGDAVVRRRKRDRSAVRFNRVGGDGLGPNRLFHAVAPIAAARVYGAPLGECSRTKPESGTLRVLAAPSR